MEQLFIFVVIGIAVAAVAYFWVMTQRRSPGVPDTGPQTTAGKLSRLRVGDILRYSLLPDRNLMVTGFIDYREDEYTWREVRLAEGDFVRWLEIEEEDFKLDLTLWKEIELTVPRDGEMPNEISHAGKTYRLKESGLAQASLTGQTGARKQHLCRYWDYTAEGGRSLLSIEQWGGDIEVSLGEPVNETRIEVFPAT